MEERKILKRLMKKKLPEGALREELEGMKISATYGNAIWLQLVKKAAAGDLSAAKYVREALVEPEQTQPDEDMLREMPTGMLRQLLGEG